MSLGWDIAELVECLSSMPEVLDLIPGLYKLSIVMVPVIPAPGQWRQEDYKLKVIVS